MRLGRRRGRRKKVRLSETKIEGVEEEPDDIISDGGHHHHGTLSASPTNHQSKQTAEPPRSVSTLKSPLGKRHRRSAFRVGGKQTDEITQAPLQTVSETPEGKERLAINRVYTAYSSYTTDNNKITRLKQLRAMLEMIDVLSDDDDDEEEEEELEEEEEREEEGG